MSEDPEVVILVPDDTAEDWSFAENEARVLRIPRQAWQEVTEFLLHPQDGVRTQRPMPYGS